MESNGRSWRRLDTVNEKKKKKKKHEMIAKLNWMVDVIHNNGEYEDVNVNVFSGEWETSINK